MKIYKISAAVIALSMLASCGGDSEESTEETEETVEEVGPTFEESCTEGNDVFVQIEKYGSGFDSTFSYNGKVEIVRSEWNVANDSTATLNLYNYELGAADTNTNFQILAEFHGKNGEKLQEGSYGYNAYDENLWAKINIITPLGTIWFNWVSSMPDQGYASINYFDNDGACGEFVLEVNKPNNTTIGHVVLKGPWSTL